jgi:HEAT repeat protein
MNDLIAKLAVGLLLKGTLVIGAAAIASLLLRRAAAATRSAVWSVAFVALLLLPLGSIVLPRWTLSPVAPPMSPPVPAVANVVSSERSIAMPPDAGHAVEQDWQALAPLAGSPERPRPWMFAALALWVAGVLVGATRLAGATLSVRALSRTAFPAAPDDVATRLCAQLALALGVTRTIDLRYSSELGVPVNWGLLRPVIVLPVIAQEWTEQWLRAALLHELAHVRRRDYASHLVARLARIVYWVNPLAWAAERLAAVEQDRACDDEVLRFGTGPVDYAQQLVDLARGYLEGGSAPRGALAMAQRTTLGTRMRAILAAGLERGAVRRRTLVLTVLVAGFVVMPLATVRLLGEGRAAGREREALRQLDATQVPARAQAAWALGDAGSTRAVEPLLRRLADPAPAVRGLAAWALGEIGDRRAFDPLVAALGDADSDVREMAVLGLAALGDRRAVAAFAPLTHDPTMGVRAVLTPSLGQLGGPDAVRLLSEILLGDPDDHPRAMAAANLRLLDPRAAVEPLVAVLAHPSPEVRGAALYSLLELGDARAIEPLGRVARTDPVARLRGLAAQALGGTRDPRAVEPLVAALGDSAYGVRVSAVYALGAVGGARATATLLDALRDPVHQVRLAAVETLQEMKRND